MAKALQHVEDAKLEGVWAMKVLFTYIGNNVPHVRPIGLSTMAAVLLSDGHEVQLFDTTFMDIGRTSVIREGEEVLLYKPSHLDKNYHSETKHTDPLREFEEKILEFKPNIIASSVVSDMFFPTLDFLESIQPIRSGIIVIMGGVGVTVDPDFAIAQETIDYICVGEGENALREFVAAVDKGIDPSNIPGIWSKRNGNIKRTGVGTPADLDSLPFLNWDLYDERYSCKPYRGKVFRGGDIMITRGCSHSCSYCANSYIRGLYSNEKHKYIRTKSVERSIQELVYLKKQYGMEFIKFHDESFLSKSWKYLQSFSTEYQKKVGIPFTCMVDARSVNKETAGILKDMNCVSVSIGLESADEKYRSQVLNKPMSDQSILNAVRELKDHGIRVVSFNMIGLPHQTIDLVWQTMRLNKEAKVDIADVFYFFPYKGTALREECEREKLYSDDEDRHSYYRKGTTSLNFPTEFKKELQRIQSTFNLYLKTPRILHPIITLCGYNNIFARALRRAFAAMFLHY